MHHGDEDVTNVIGGCACGGNGEGLAGGASTEQLRTTSAANSSNGNVPA